MFGDWIVFLFSKFVFILFSKLESKYNFFFVFNHFFLFGICFHWIVFTYNYHIIIFLPQIQHNDANPGSPSGRAPPKVDKELVPVGRRQSNVVHHLLHCQPKQKPKTHNPQQTHNPRQTTANPLLHHNRRQLTITANPSRKTQIISPPLATQATAKPTIVGQPPIATHNPRQTQKITNP